MAPILTRHCVDCHDAEQADGGYRVDSYAAVLQGGTEVGRAVLPGKPDDSPLVQYVTGKRTPRMPLERKMLSESEIAVLRDWIARDAPEGEPPIVFSEEQLTFFEANVRPLLARHCLECHGEDRANGGLAFLSREDLLEGGTRGPALVPGMPAESVLIAAVRHTGELQMPRGRPQLDGEAIALLEQWIAIGAPWPAVDRSNPPKIRKRFVVYESDRSHWAFQPVTRPELPPVTDTAWPRDDLDRFVLARLEAEGLAPSPRADRRTLMRRLAFDLTGLPPSPEDLERYLGDEGEAALTDYVDQLLDSPEFGEHWARHWLDNVRYRSHRGKSDANDPYRLWVIRAFAEDMPYDRFLRMQIAGDLLPADNPDEVPLEGLTAVRPWSLKSRDHEQIDLLGRTFLGLSVFCAQCHDHKLEPLARSDYFALKGIFDSSRVVEAPFVRQRSEFDEYMTGLARTQANSERMKKELKQYNLVAGLVTVRERIEAERAKLDDPKQDREKVQKSLDKLLEDEEKRLQEIEKRGLDLDAPEAREYVRLQQENAAFEQKWKSVDLIEVFVDQEDPEKIGDAAPPMADDEADPAPAVDTRIPRRFPIILAGEDQIPLGERTAQSGRLELADWLADPEHPITARLMTNRIWYYLLGEGLTPSLSNFGRSGQPPTHPDLLDHLADDFVRSGWSMKQLIRRIVLSSTYQQSSRLPEAQEERDRRLRLFGVARRKRLEAESIWRTLEVLENDPQSDDRRREPPVDFTRTVTALFDGADPNLIVPRRTASASPLQALFLMNNEHVRAGTERFAARLHALAEDDNRRIGTAYLMLYGREPTAEEHTAGLAFLSEWNGTTTKTDNRRTYDVPPEQLAKWQAYLQILLLSNEFLYVD